MSHHEVDFNYYSQEHLLNAGCFDMRLIIEVVEKTLLDFEKGSIMFPEKIVQIFDEKTQNRINCLPATMLDEKICGVKWVSVFPENPRKFDVQNLSAIFVLSEIERGFPVAVMDGTLASNMRVGAVGAVAAKHLAIKDAETIGFIGAGEQAKMHLLAMKVVRPTLKVCRVTALTAAEEQGFIDQLSPILPDMEFIAANGDIRLAMEGADILVTATGAQAPLLKAEWVKPGAFYSHVGGWEDEYAVASLCDKIVCDDWETVKHRTQTVSRMYKEGLIDDRDVHADLHELVSGDKPGRESDDERIYFDAVGLSFLDVAIALTMFKRAKEAGEGISLELQHEMIFEHADIASKVRL
ncbi:ornithine cyclodeaminase/alanine dehydrogenase [Mariprofundus aestuarium]|uniref:Ornithine cyclodeaminase/alanine dehydrogenase n=1 Tax=Mariprofundus aestuarium TaxID=1921086 RepID=A0A2K8KY61_MARES|nr:ornithine cyclodeaminase family protein [Mariprofundus aestuarium]ATX79898.1 ornithine cyclodeaminase/alanine dehydrogenase [Mariprofundus aestuarium]